MKLGKCEVTNFGSYKHLQFDFSNRGLTLVHGSTGSGKSTLQDIPAWVLFGQTAKDGNVDEVRSWQAAGEPTRGSLEVHLPSGTLTVIRVRGRSSENDLYWQALDGEVQRGKDVNESQKRLSALLGVDALAYTLGAYYHEFSPAGSFFTATAKSRRALLDSVFTSTLPGILSVRSAEARKGVREYAVKLQRDFDGASGALTYARQQLNRSTREFDNWDSLRAERRRRIERDAEEWQGKKEDKIDSLLQEIEACKAEVQDEGGLDLEIARLRAGTKCGVCGGVNAAVAKRIDTLKEKKFKNQRAKDKEEALLDKLQALIDSPNPYVVEAQASDLDEPNPHGVLIEQAKADIAKYTSLCDTASEALKAAQERVSALNQLQDLSSELRAALLAHAVSAIESDTNAYLETHFESEIRVKFTLTDADNLEVEVTKNGYECVYRQLSKGQRGLLKLCFAVSIMQAASNRAGVTFDTLCFDEALDGLDATNKVKAFSLFEALAQDHGTIMVIDHATELQSMFDKRYHVSLNGDFSQIEAE